MMVQIVPSLHILLIDLFEAFITEQAKYDEAATDKQKD